METSTVDAPPVEADAAPQPAVAQTSPPPAQGAATEQAAGTATGANGALPASAHACANCGAPMADKQDWCLQCGAGAPGSLGTPGWRPTATILGVTLALLLVAAGAGYAALSKSRHKARVVTATVAQATTAPLPPGTTTPPPATSTPGATIPPVTAKPPKIPLTATTPKVGVVPALPLPKATTPASTTPSTTTTTGGSSGEEAPASSALVLDTNAASTYNPYNYPAASFGDPSLAIDGDGSTGWTAQVDPATAPKLAEGLLVNLKSAQKLKAVDLVTSTPGITVQVYGANGKKVPASITDPAWVAMSRSIVVNKRHLHIALREPKHAVTFVTVWISRAPAGSTGTAQQPARVSINELELFPAA